MKYWAQVTVLIGALGYLIKIPLDYFIKRSEQRFNHLMAEQSRAIGDLLVKYEAFQIAQHNLLSDYRNGTSISYADIQERTSLPYRDLLSSGSVLRFYLNTQEYTPFKKMGDSIIEIAGLISKETHEANSGNRTREERDQFFQKTVKDIIDGRIFISSAADEFQLRFFGKRKFWR